MKIYTLAYANDIVLMAKEEKAMWSMIERFEANLQEKQLELNKEKTKIMRCKKEEGRRDRIIQRSKRMVIKEIKEFKYLGYVLQQNGRQATPIKDKVKRAVMIMKQLWRIRKRKYGGD